MDTPTDTLWVESVGLAGWSIPPAGDTTIRQGYRVPVVVQATEHWFTVDLSRGRREAPARLYEIPIESINALELAEWSAERSEFRWQSSTGTETIQATSGLVVTIGDGDYLIFRLNGPVVAARPRLGRLLALVAAR